MVNPQPHLSTDQPWIWREFAQQLPIDTVRTGIAGRAASFATLVRLPSWAPGELVATHEAYGAALRPIGAAYPFIVAMEGAPDSSTYAQVFPAGRAAESMIADQRAT